MHISAKIVTVF